MDILTFQSKRFGRVPVNSGKQPRKPLSVVLQGSAYWVEEPEAISFLTAQGKYGHKMGERQNNVNPEVFVNETDLIREYWKSKVPSVRSLELSPEEVVYLYFIKKWLVVYKDKQALSPDDLWSTLNTGSKFIERSAVYCKLREFGWCVRSGLTYGCQYLVYKESPNNYHASAGVFIGNSVGPNHLVSLTRALTNVKKALIVATVSPSDSISAEDLQDVTVEFLTSQTFFPERLENRES